MADANGAKRQSRSASNLSSPRFFTHTAHSDKHALHPRAASPLSKRPRTKCMHPETSVFPLQQLPHEVVSVVLEHVAGVSLQQRLEESNHLELMRQAFFRLLPLAAASRTLCANVLSFFNTFVPFDNMYRFIPSVSENALHAESFRSKLFAAARNAAYIMHQNARPPYNFSRSHRERLYNSLSIFSEQHSLSCRVVTSCALLLPASDVLDIHFLSDFSHRITPCILSTFMFMNIRFEKLVVSSSRHLPFVTRNADLCFQDFLRSVKATLKHLEMSISVHHQRAMYPQDLFPVMPELRSIHFKVQHMDESNSANGPCFQLLPKQLLRRMADAFRSLNVVTVQNMYRTPSDLYQAVKLPSSVFKLRIVRDISVIGAFRRCSQLRIITFHRVEVDLCMLVHFVPRRAFPNLKRIALIACNLSLGGPYDENMLFLCTNIQTLMSDNDCSCTALEPHHLELLRERCPNLAVLDFWMAAPEERFSWTALGSLVETLEHLRVLIVEAAPVSLEEYDTGPCALFCECLARSCSSIHHLSLSGSWLSMEAFDRLITVKGADLRSLKVHLCSKDVASDAYVALNTSDVIRALCAIRKYCPKLDSLCVGTQEEMSQHMSQIKLLSPMDCSALDVTVAEEVWEKTAKDYCCTKFRLRMTREYSGIDVEPSESIRSERHERRESNTVCGSTR